MKELKGFIEVTLQEIDNPFHVGKMIMPLTDIKKILEFNSYCEIIDTDNVYYLPSESYEEIKQLIKNAQ